MDDCPVTGQSPQGCRRNPDPCSRSDYGLARKPQTWLRSRRCFERDRSLAGAATTDISIGTRIGLSETTKCERSRAGRESPDGRE